ncbi:MAG: hypothetical protein JXX28_13340 [Deltaproteobacteria bacterium]|nr:hypothetical protein [Deltaproteobacteria bacterium]
MAASNLRVAPGLSLEAKGPQVRFAGQGEYIVRKYGRAYSNLDRYSDFGFNGSMVAREKQSVGFMVGWNATMVNLPVDKGGPDPFSTRFRNHLAPTMILRGAAIEFSLNGLWDFDDFQSASGAQYSTTDPTVRGLNRRNTGGIGGELAWKFLPRTALVLSGDYSYRYWEDNWVLAVNTSEGTPIIDLGTHLAIPNSYEYRFQGGFRGRFTNRLVITAEGGMGRAVYDEESVLRDAEDEGGRESAFEDGDAFTVDVSGSQRYLGSVQLRYEVAPDSFVTLGYSRDFGDSWFSNYLVYNNVYADISARMGARVRTVVGFSGRTEDYFGEISRQDVMLRTKGDLTYYVDDWASVTAGVWWDERASSDVSAEYDDINVHLMTTFTY